ncbi:MAG: general secretion pathway protein GspB [Algiphilus sp.]
MSHILDALRQAEDERRLGQPPGRSAIASPLRAARRRSHAPWLRWVVLLCFMLGLGVVLWLGYARLPASGPAPSRTAPSDSTEFTQAPAVLATPVTPPASTAPSSPNPPLFDEKQPAAVTTPDIKVDTEEAISAPTETMPRAQLADAPRIDSLDALFEGSAETPRRSASATDSADATDSMSLQPQDIFRDPEVPNADRAAAPARGAEPFDAATRIASDWEDLPRASRVGMPPIRIDVHVYNQDPERRFVRINGQRRVEGDRLDNEARIEAITREGLVLRWRGMRLAQPLNR